MSTIVEDMAQEIRTAIANGETLEEIEDQSGEWIDGFLPVYNNRIVSEWQNMPSEYDNRGASELGYHQEEINIINLMSLDLYLYYSDLWNQALANVAQELEELA